MTTNDQVNEKKSRKRKDVQRQSKTGGQTLAKTSHDDDDDDGDDELSVYSRTPGSRPGMKEWAVAVTYVLGSRSLTGWFSFLLPPIADAPCVFFATSKRRKNRK